MALYGVSPMLPSLPDELQQRRSAQASDLQAAQSQMPGLGQMPRGSGAGGSPSSSSRPTFSGIMQQRQQQASQIQARQQDLQIGERLLQVFDPRLPKPTRQFIYRQLSRELGVDPKGESSKELGAWATGLDPQASEQVRRGISAQIQSAEPGQVSQMARGVISGQIPPTQLMQLSQMSVATANGEGAGSEGSSGNFPERMSLGGPGRAPSPAAPGSTSGVTQAQMMTPPGRPGDTISPQTDPGPARMPFTASPSSSVPPVPMERTIPPLLREVAPELAGILGLDVTQRYRNMDILRGGWARIPTDYEGQQKLASDIKGVQDGVVNMTVMGNQLVDIIRGRPEVLSLGIGRIPVPFAGQWNLELPNPSSVLTQLGSYGNSMARTFGWDGTKIDPQSDDGAKVMSRSRELAERVFSWSPETQRNANDTAVMQSLLINIAFAMAASKGQTGRFLSDRDVELQLQELGRSSDPEQFSNTVSRVVQRAYDQYRVRMRSQTGGDVAIAPVATEDARAILMSGQITPRRMVQELGGTGQEDRSFTRPPPPAPTQGDQLVPDPQRAQGMGVNIGGEFETFSGGVTPRLGTAPSIPSVMPDLRSPIPGNEAPPRRPGPLERASPTIESEEALARQRIEEDRAAVLEGRAHSRRMLEIQESQEARAARNETRAVEEQRRQRIRDAFSQLAAAMRSSGSAGIGVSSGAGGGGDQDPNAFRLNPAPQRRPPAPVDAAPYQPRRR